MKINEPSAAFKLLGGHIVLHLALLTMMFAFKFGPDSILDKYACPQSGEKQVIEILIISHIVTAIVSVVYEVSTGLRWFSVQAFCEIVRIPTYFYVIMYAGYKGLAMITDQDVGCIDGKLPLHEVIVMIELGTFGYWILSTPMFLICSKFLGYDSIEEVQINNGLRKKVSTQESKWRLDFLDYSKTDL